MPPVYANPLVPSVAHGVRTQGLLAVTELGHQDSDNKTLSTETTIAANLRASTCSDTHQRANSELQRPTSATEQRANNARHQRPNSDLQRQTSATEQRAISADNQSGAVATRPAASIASTQHSLRNYLRCQQELCPAVRTRLMSLLMCLRLLPW